MVSPAAVGVGTGALPLQEFTNEIELLYQFVLQRKSDFMSRRHSLWLESIVQIPLIFLGICLVGYALFRVLEIGGGNQLKWIVFWLGTSWISLMWTLTLPLDRLLQGILSLRWSLAGQLALGHSLFWTVATSLLLWKLLRLPIPPDLPFPLFPK